MRSIRLVTDLNVGKLILIITVNCASNAISRDTLRDASLISIDQLILGSFMLFLLMERVASDFYLATINIDLIWSRCVSLPSL